MHYLLTVPEFEQGGERPPALDDAQAAGRAAGRAAFDAKLASLDQYRDEAGLGYGPRLLALVMLNVIDEKWKDHLYDLDQLRAAIGYRGWGQKDPLIEYKQEAYSMFVDLMADIHNTFAERFLRVQLVFEMPPGGYGGGQAGGNGPAGGPAPGPRRPTKRYNALGILEDIPAEELAGDGRENGHGDGAGAPGRGAEEAVLDVAPGQPPKKEEVVKRDPVVVGAGRARPLNAPRPSAPVDWSSVGRNDPCPCGSGRKFKKCHGASMR